MTDYDEAEWRESLRKEYERANSWKALYTATVTERDVLREALVALSRPLAELVIAYQDADSPAIQDTLRRARAALEAKP